MVLVAQYAQILKNGVTIVWNANKTIDLEKLGKMVPIIATCPFQIMERDIITSLSATKRDNKAILVFTD